MNLQAVFLKFGYFNAELHFNTMLPLEQVLMTKQTKISDLCKNRRDLVTQQ